FHHDRRAHPRPGPRPRRPRVRARARRGVSPGAGRAPPQRPRLPKEDPMAVTMAVTPQPILTDGQWIAGKAAALPVMDKYRLAQGALVSTADDAQVEQTV